jgi:hypothetical protein
MASREEAQRLMALFAGNDDYHGTHGCPERDEDKGKWTIKSTAKTIKDAVTVQHWGLHLSGERPLGVAPIRSDASCSWGSIDIDDYDVVPVEVISKLEALKYPLVPVRSKSGGLHLFLFLNVPEPARQVQTTLRDMAASIGQAGAEIFPKQTNLMIDRGDQPNWMCMPYLGTTFDGKLCEQAGLKRSGGEMTLGEFLRVAEGARTTTGEIKIKRKSVKTNSMNGHGHPFGDGPPCLQHLAVSGVPRGGQSNALLMMGIYYKRAYPEDWKGKLEEANTKFLDPPGTADGLVTVIKSLEKKDYWYTCKAEPMVSHCNSGVCRTREFGVGDSGYFPQIQSLTKLKSEPVLWFVDVDGYHIELNTQQLRDYRRFCDVCLEQGSKEYAPMKAADWSTVLRAAVANVTEIEAPKDIGPDGHFLELLTRHLTNRTRADRPEDLLGGRPWEDTEGLWGERGAYYFELARFMSFLEREKVKDFTRNDVTRRVKKLGGGSVQKTIKKGQFRNLWRVPGELIIGEGKLDGPVGEEELI